MLVTVAAAIASLFCHVGNDPIVVAVASLDLTVHSQPENEADKNKEVATGSEAAKPAKVEAAVEPKPAKPTADETDVRDDVTDVVEMEVTEIDAAAKVDEVEPAAVVDDEVAIEKAPVSAVEESPIVSDEVAKEEPVLEETEEPSVATTNDVASEVDAVDVEIESIPKELFAAWPSLKDETKATILMLIKADELTK